METGIKIKVTLTVKAYLQLLEALTTPVSADNAYLGDMEYDSDKRYLSGEISIPYHGIQSTPVVDLFSSKGFEIESIEFMQVHSQVLPKALELVNRFKLQMNGPIRHTNKKPRDEIRLSIGFSVKGHTVDAIEFLQKVTQAHFSVKEHARAVAIKL